MKVEQAGDQCTLGCNFDTMRPLRDILAIYKAVLGPVFGPTAYAGRLLRLAVMLDRSDRRRELPDGDMRKRLGDIDSVHMIMRALPEVCEPFWKTFTADGAVHAPRAVLEALTAGLASWTVCLRTLWLGGGRREPNPECHYLRAGRDLTSWWMRSSGPWPSRSQTGSPIIWRCGNCGPESGSLPPYPPASVIIP